MPKIDVQEQLFFELLGKKMSLDELEALLPIAKAELDEKPDMSQKPEERTIKIELNDTNRPDLWSTAGIARQLKTYLSGTMTGYPFFSAEGNLQKARYTITVDASVKEVRPYLTAFVISGKPISDAMLRDAIQTQEKLCWNFGRKRKSVSMGLYRISLISWPVTYHAVEPLKASFAPLGYEKIMNLAEILEEHPKGKEYGHILKGNKLYPLLSDSKGRILSFPPIINSNDIGAVQVGDTDLLVEFTGTDILSVALSASIVACDFADVGYTIEPVEVRYAFDTPLGRNQVYPFYFQLPTTVDIARASALLGKSISTEKAREALARMGVESEIHGQFVKAWPPVYRNDFLHQVDLIEDIMIGIGLEQFEPEKPQDFTIGRLTPIEEFSRLAKNIMVGLGFQEMIYNYLGSRRDFIEKMGLSDEGVIRIANPMTENYEYVRPSILPSLLQSESVSAKAVYPHKIFEIGKVAFIDHSFNTHTSTRQRLAFLTAHGTADFNEAANTVSVLAYYLGIPYEVQPSDDVRFIPGRQAQLMLNGKPAGIFGEVHPQVLENWDITMPCVAGEFDLEFIMQERQ